MHIPATLRTGFLGSGKTTVLNHLVRQPELSRTLVIVNGLQGRTTVSTGLQGRTTVSTLSL